MAIIFTSDTHFGHTKVIEYSHRSFRNADEMNEQLIKNWNRAVTPNDQVYFLGDFSFMNQTKTRYILDRLNGKIYLIRGNHDNDILKPLCANRFEWIKDYYYLKVSDTDGPDGKTQPVILFHYPIQSWNHRNYLAWHFHGHIHSKNGIDKTQYRYDVGIDNNCMRPISYEKIKKLFKQVNFKPTDYHE